jgi:hypothetical protein
MIDGRISIFVKKIKRGFQAFIKTFTSGSWTLVESDPVWCVNFFSGGVGLD